MTAPPPASAADDAARFRRAVFEIDLRNADDPHVLQYQGRDRLKEQLHAELVTAWVERLAPVPSEELLLAARAHHIRRWTIAREDYATGRGGYHQWRFALKDLHAAELGEILKREGYPAAAITRAQAIVRRRELTADPEQQTLEDAICLAFLETQLDAVAAKLPRAKLDDILRKTAGKMSPAAVEHARATIKGFPL